MYALTGKLPHTKKPHPTPCPSEKTFSANPIYLGMPTLPETYKQPRAKELDFRDTKLRKSPHRALNLKYESQKANKHPTNPAESVAVFLEI